MRPEFARCNIYKHTVIILAENRTPAMSIADWRRLAIEGKLVFIGVKSEFTLKKEPDLISVKLAAVAALGIVVELAVLHDNESLIDNLSKTLV